MTHRFCLLGSPIFPSITPTLNNKNCWLCANAGYVPMLAVCQCWLCANAGYVPMLAMCQCWLCANASCVPMLAVCQCGLFADAHRVHQTRFVSSIFFKFLFCVLHTDISQSVWFAVVTDDRRQDITK